MQIQKVLQYIITNINIEDQQTRPCDFYSIWVRRLLKGFYFLIAYGVIIMQHFWVYELFLSYGIRSNVGLSIYHIFCHFEYMILHDSFQHQTHSLPFTIQKTEPATCCLGSRWMLQHKLDVIGIQILHFIVQLCWLELCLPHQIKNIPCLESHLVLKVTEKSFLI